MPWDHGLLLRLWHGEFLHDQPEQHSSEFLSLFFGVVLDEDANNFTYLNGTTIALTFAGESSAGRSSVRGFCGSRGVVARTIWTHQGLADLVQHSANDRLGPARNGSR